MTRYLVTGGAGFIGSSIVEELVKRGHIVRVADNFATGRRENLKAVMDKIELVEGDLAELDFARHVARDVDYVLHQAAIPSVPRSVADPILNNRSGVIATLNMLVAAKDAKVKRMTFASSSSIYGEAFAGAKREDMQLLPLSPYGVSKMAAEGYCVAFHTVYGFETVCLRYFNVFGPRQDPTSEYSAVVPKFITALLNKKPRRSTATANRLVTSLMLATWSPPTCMSLPRPPKARRADSSTWQWGKPHRSINSWICSTN